MTLETDADIQAAWSAGSYGELATNYLSMAGRVVERAGITSTDSVLDVGCGPGSVAITAARRDAEVVGIDITPAMLDEARSNEARADVAEIDWQEGTATDLPFAADTFDATLSSLGHMYGDPPSKTVREIRRVTRPEGRIVFTSWTPSSVYPTLAGLLSTRLSTEDLPAYAAPPFMWGDRETVRRRLEAGFENVSFERRAVSYPALSPAHFWKELSTRSGVFRTFLDTVEDTSNLRDEMIDTIESFFDPSRNSVELEYILTHATITVD